MLSSLLLLLVLGLPTVATADTARPSTPSPTPGRPWFGPTLDINEDGPLEYADRLGATASLYTFPVDYPLTGEGVDQLRLFAADAATQGAALVVQVEPTVPCHNGGRALANGAVHHQRYTEADRSAA